MHDADLVEAKFEALESTEFIPGLDYDDVTALYQESTFGRFHARQRLRFKPYAYDQTTMFQDLGNDVHPVYHMPHTHDRVIQPLLHCQIRDDQHDMLAVSDVKLLRLTALIHDIGECADPRLIETCGRITDDIPILEKTEDDEIAESVIRRYLYKELFSVIPQTILEQVEAIILQKNKNNYNTRIFRVGEDVGYYQTGNGAAEIALQNIEAYQTGRFMEDTRLKKLGSMAVKVPNYWRPSLEDQADEFPFVKRELARTRDTHKATNRILLRELVVV